MNRKLISILLVLAMLLCMLPAALAEDIIIIDPSEELGDDSFLPEEAYEEGSEIFLPEESADPNADSSVKYRALLVGEVHFSWETATRNQGDVNLLNQMLASVTGPEGNSYSVTCKYDLSNSGIQSAISSAFSGADSNDVSLFFIATHGVTDVASGSYAGELVTIKSAGSSEEYLTLGQLATWLKAVPGKVIVVLGSCGSGAAIYNSNGIREFVEDDSNAADELFTQSVIETFQKADEEALAAGDQANTGEFRQSKFYVLTAAAHQQSSWGTEYYGYNYFPLYFFAGGYYGAADSNADLIITLNEMYKYCYEKAMGPYNDGTGDYIQEAQVYPTNSSYPLFRFVRSNPFVDVKTGKYYYYPVLWAYYEDPQITGGTDATHFSPSQTCTREQIITFLWKLCGAPDFSSYSNPFSDVKSGKYYYSAVLWANYYGITGGVDSTHFGVGQPCTRAQAMTFLWKASGSPTPASGSNPFSDVKSGKYYYNAVLWAYQNGITGGVDSTHFGVNQTCTRGQIVTFLFKAYGL